MDQNPEEIKDEMSQSGTIKVPVLSDLISGEGGRDIPYFSDFMD